MKLTASGLSSSAPFPAPLLVFDSIFCSASAPAASASPPTTTHLSKPRHHKQLQIACALTRSATQRAVCHHSLPVAAIRLRLRLRLSVGSRAPIQLRSIGTIAVGRNDGVLLFLRLSLLALEALLDAVIRTQTTGAVSKKFELRTRWDSNPQPSGRGVQKAEERSFLPGGTADNNDESANHDPKDRSHGRLFIL